MQLFRKKRPYHISPKFFQNGVSKKWINFQNGCIWVSYFYISVHGNVVGGYHENFNLLGQFWKMALFSGFQNLWTTRATLVRHLAAWFCVCELRGPYGWCRRVSIFAISNLKNFGPPYYIVLKGIQVINIISPSIHSILDPFLSSRF